MVRLVRWLAALGALAVFLATAWLVFVLALICFDYCPSDVMIPGYVADHLPRGGLGFLAALALLLPAWILCLLLLTRAGERRRAFGVAASPIAGGGLAVGFMLLAGRGELLPTTLTAFNAWDGGLIWAGTALLLWPAAILAATRGLGPRKDRGGTGSDPATAPIQ